MLTMMDVMCGKGEIVTGLVVGWRDIGSVDGGVAARVGGCLLSMWEPILMPARGFWRN